MGIAFRILALGGTELFVVFRIFVVVQLNFVHRLIV